MDSRFQFSSSSSCFNRPTKLSKGVKFEFSSQEIALDRFNTTRMEPFFSIGHNIGKQLSKLCDDFDKEMMAHAHKTSIVATVKSLWNVMFTNFSPQEAFCLDIKSKNSRTRRHCSVIAKRCRVLFSKVFNFIIKC
ncbi:hypothetical protein L5515_018863 [Caenorhabditis briggsae]|uniref:Uncharacterized protein n=1 Tax=Caenorhabditis briggsae TaxID=6238 RepID=A0AAE9FGU1_CAEBR|nr:hypothetical protein L5515_018863 [Caenorhabditis briggsae]